MEVSFQVKKHQGKARKESLGRNDGCRDCLTKHKKSSHYETICKRKKIIVYNF